MQGGLLWYFHTYVGSVHFFFGGGEVGGGGGGKIKNFNIYEVFRKNDFFWGYEDFVDIFLWSSKTWTIIMGHFCAF